jgi:hypothetical protein
MSNTPYVGGLAAWGNVAQLQQAAEAANARPETAECGHTVQNGRVVLEGESPIATDPVHQTVPNLPIEHVQTPVTKRGLPGNVATDQNPLTAGSGLRRGRR